MGTSRRSLLRGALALPVLAAPAAAATCDVTPIASLWAERQRLLALHVEALENLDAANAKREAETPPEPEEAIVPERWRRFDSWRDEIRGGEVVTLGTSYGFKSFARYVGAGRARDEALRRARVMKEYEDERARRFGDLILAADEAFYEADDRLLAIEKMIIAMPATTLRDIAMKVAIARRQDQEDMEGLPLRPTLAVLDDIDRFAALAAT